MGIPGYFARYANRYAETIIKRKLEMIDALFLDFNCAIHPCCRKFSKEQYSHNRKDICEKYMIEECISHLMKIIKYTNPSRLVYLAIDGVAPRAKMVQQRNRRFKSIKDKEYDIEIRKRTGYIDPNISEELRKNEDELWDTNSISPGTTFMSKLSDAIKKHFKDIEDPQFEQLTIIISDSSNEGEGEHKILDYLRKHNQEITPDHNIVIYGLDADLIMLSMVSHINRIYLLRESTEFGKDYFDASTTFCYLDIDLFKFSIIQELSSKIIYKMPMTEQLQMIDDYIFLSFMIGNDFLPNLPPLTIKDSGLDLLTDIYTSIFIKRTKILKKYQWVRDKTVNAGHHEMEGGWRTDKSNYTEDMKFEYLVDIEKGKINYEFLAEIFERLGAMEYELMTNLETKRERLRPYNKNTNSHYEAEKNDLENLPILNRKNEIKIDIRNPDKSWYHRYYKACFHFEPTEENINNACFKYFQGLLWNLTYYYKGCNSWEWYYPYHHSPTLKDLNDFIKDNSNIQKIKLHKSPPFTPFEQLMFILPPESKHLLPESYQSLMSSNSPVAQYYPDKYEFDTIYKRYFWQCPPILPPINASHLRKVISRKHLTKEEQQRNQKILF